MHIDEQREKSKSDALIENIKLQSPHPRKDYSAEKSFARLMNRIKADDHSAEVFQRRAHRYGAWLAAATVALLVAMSGWLYTTATSDNNPSFIVKTNHTGLVQDVILPDGSAIKLNNQSQLVYPKHFSGNTREVFLEGEAYFDVEHDKRHPFIVHAGELKIRVLGTKFTINASSHLPQITTTLLEGSIDVTNDRESILMKPNQQLMYDISGRKMMLTDLTNATREIRWTHNVWVLSDTPLLDICQRLEQQFNVKFIIMNDKLIGKSFTGEFYTNESLESILKSMQISTSFNYERKGRNIILR